MVYMIEGSPGRGLPNLFIGDAPYKTEPDISSYLFMERTLLTIAGS
jgi:hypothetical protein